MSRIILRFIFVITLTLGVASAWAETMYVTDSFEITVRRGTSTEYKIIAMLRSNQKVEALENLGAWTKIRLTNGEEGYVLSRYLTPKIPKSFIITGLQKKLKTSQEELRNLREAKGTLEVSNSELEASLRSNMGKLAKLEKDYEALKSGSAHYIEVKQTKDQLEIDNKKLESQLAAVSEKNRELERKKDSLWFVSGAGVLVAGWVFGLLMGRTQLRRKRRPLYDV